MTLGQILGVIAAYCATSLVVGLVIGRVLRSADYPEVCVDCDRPATHERLVNADTAAFVVELACGQHGEVRR